jgi:NAD(P)-dependent dehydrogenase (short-subunit alcohol dehydrogenase family)
MSKPFAIVTGASSRIGLELAAIYAGGFDLTNRPSRRRRQVSLPVAGTVLLPIDVINDLAFPGSEVLVAQAEPAPADCIVSNTIADNEHALRQIETVIKGKVAPSTQFRFRGRGRREKDRRP